MNEAFKTFNHLKTNLPEALEGSSGQSFSSLKPPRCFWCCFLIYPYLNVCGSEWPLLKALEKEREDPTMCHLISCSGLRSEKGVAASTGM